MSAKSADNRSGARRRKGSSSALDSASQPAAAPSAKTTAGKTAEDVALVCGVSEDGQGMEIIRKRGDRIETGTVRPLQAGKPIHGEVVRLRPRAQAPFLCDVEVELAAPAREDRAEVAGEAGSLSGPAQVATDSYRKNWDAVYGRTRKPSLLN